MSSAVERIKDMIGWGDEMEYEEEGYVEEEEYEQKKPSFFRSNKKVINMNAANEKKVVVIKAEEYNDAQLVCDSLKENRPVVVNLEDVDTEEGQRIVDFLSGVIYSLNGNIKKVTSHILLMTPYDIDIDGNEKERKSKNSFNWL